MVELKIVQLFLDFGTWQFHNDKSQEVLQAWLLHFHFRLILFSQLQGELSLTK